MPTTHPETKLTIIGSGIIGAFEAYYAFLAARQQGQRIRITILEKHASEAASTSSNIVPSLTPDEILSVVPRGQELVKKLQLLYDQPGGIRVDDVRGANDSDSAQIFKNQVSLYSEQEAAHLERTKTLLALGKRSMDLWQTFYDLADAELKTILIESNFNPCREPAAQATPRLHDGYRIDLIFNVPNAKARAAGMIADYAAIGYQQCKLLTPADVLALDPFLQDFCQHHAQSAAMDQWQDDAVALWRPGGCLDTHVFLPKFYTYLRKLMGQYQAADGSLRDCLAIKFGRQVNEVVWQQQENQTRVAGLKFFNNPTITPDQHEYRSKQFVFCPGEAVGTLARLGFAEPSYAGFAGAVLTLRIPVPAAFHKAYANFNHCMEVHQEGVVLAWQARFHEGYILIGVGGTKAFYGDQLPHVAQAFARNRNLLQLNIINNVLPEFISLALGRATQGAVLTERDLAAMETQGIATRWVGTRAVSAEGFPTLGRLFHQQRPVVNARTTTHLGSGGVSFAPAAVTVSRAADEEKSTPDDFTSSVLSFSDSRRMW